MPWGSRLDYLQNSLVNIIRRKLATGFATICAGLAIADNSITVVLPRKLASGTGSMCNMFPMNEFEGRKVFDRYSMSALSGYLALLCLIVAYCYWCETPEAASFHLGVLLLAALVGIVICVILGTLGLAAGIYLRSAMLIAVAVMAFVIFIVALRRIGDDRRHLALDVAITAVQTQDASGLERVEGFTAEEQSHFFLLRMSDGRVFVVQVKVKGRSFYPADVIER